ncbi:MAG: sigma-70 family RNA polymerase sigma factor [Planctomycetota bacterium]
MTNDSAIKQRLPSDSTEAIRSGDASEVPLTLDDFGDGELLDAWISDRLAAAFSTLVQRHSVMVLSVCRRKCRSLGDADDAYQSTFLLLAKNAPKIRRPECLPGWLHRVATRASLATLRKTESDGMIDSLLAEEDDPLGRITQKHDAIVLDEELAELPEHYRAPIVMHVLEEQSLQRIADHFQTTLGAIRGRLQRGKKLLATRLRRRGVVPVLAFAAATTSTVSASEASAAGTALLSQFVGGTPPPTPLPESLLQPLLQSGKRVMTPWKTAGVLAIAGSITVAAMLPGFDGPGNRVSVEQPASNGDSPVFIAQVPEVVGETPKTASASPASDPSPAVVGPTIVGKQYRPNLPKGPLAETLDVKMDQQVALAIDGPIAEMPKQLQSLLESPVFLDERTLKYVELSPKTTLQFNSAGVPLRSSLRQLLAPLGLKATIETEGLVIKPDHYQLVHRGIGADRWINVDDDFMNDSAEILSRHIKFEASDMPLSEFVMELSSELGFKININRASLEEIGLDADQSLGDMKFLGVAGYDVLTNVLDNHSLGLTFRGNVHQIASLETCEQQSLMRVYYLEGLATGGDLDSLLALIENSINPDTWEALGGNSTITPYTNARPAIIVSTTYDVHRQIERMLKVIRENSFQLDAIEEPVPSRGSTQPGGGGFGGGGMGAAGGGGGGGGIF